MAPPPAPSAASAAALVLATGAALAASMAGLPLAGATATLAACAASLLFGLPHGALDLRLLTQRAPVARLALYLGLAAAMLALWRAAPIAALVMFLIMAVIHFAEDWAALEEPFLALGTAAGLLAAPGLLHMETLHGLFTALTGEAGAAVLGDVLRLGAPVGLMLALVAVLALLRRGQTALGFATGAALAGLVLLPPAIGFALYFALLHSPQHLAAELPEGTAARRRIWSRVILPMTGLSLLIAAGLALIETRPTPGDTAVVATFMALSILTTPHMLAPRLIGWLEAPRGLKSPA
ncbi:MAG: beta-carotene 15,15'-dioxygenase, Brp/Blh family [Brevundimonas sp.]|uniref:beta-carotene 15,15'-dioxygenase, Brp/Blh family n=1 Tax=Brevundimonas sp. TaxID=1871086 RepID=UPI00391B2FC6